MRSHDARCIFDYLLQLWLVVISPYMILDDHHVSMAKKAIIQQTLYICTLWLFNIAMENGPFIADLWWFTYPKYSKLVIFHSDVKFPNGTIIQHTLFLVFHWRWQPLATPTWGLGISRRGSAPTHRLCRRGLAISIESQHSNSGVDIPIYPLVNVYITMDRSTILRKLTISTGPFSIANCWFTRG